MKYSKSLPAYILMISVSIMLCFPYCLHAGHDSSARTDLNFSYTFNNPFRAVSYVFLQFDDEISRYDYTEWGIGLRYQTPLSRLSFLVYYQQGFSKDENGNWSLEQKPSINMNFHAVLYDFRISDQIRCEYRITPDWNDYRIKNTVNISSPDWFLQPYIGRELFYENHDKAVMLNRIKRGIARHICPRISLGPYYRMDFLNVDHEWKWTRQLIGFQVTAAN